MLVENVLDLLHGFQPARRHKIIRRLLDADHHLSQRRIEPVLMEKIFGKFRFVHNKLDLVVIATAQHRRARETAQNAAPKRLNDSVMARLDVVDEFSHIYSKHVPLHVQ